VLPEELWTSERCMGCRIEWCRYSSKATRVYERGLRILRNVPTISRGNPPCNRSDIPRRTALRRARPGRERRRTLSDGPIFSFTPSRRRASPCIFAVFALRAPASTLPIASGPPLSRPRDIEAWFGCRRDGRSFGATSTSRLPRRLLRLSVLIRTFSPRSSSSRVAEMKMSAVRRPCSICLMSVLLRHRKIKPSCRSRAATARRRRRARSSCWRGESQHVLACAATGSGAPCAAAGAGQSEP